MADVKIQRAIVSVYDKTDSSTSSASSSRWASRSTPPGAPASSSPSGDAGSSGDISECNGFPQPMDGRVKTLHPRVHGGLPRRPRQPRARRRHEGHPIDQIDMVVVNPSTRSRPLSPKPGVTLSEAIEQIDIGGPSMVRSAAKNHAYVAVVTSPKQYALVLDEMKKHAGATTLETRAALAREVFKTTKAKYDRAIANYLEEQAGNGTRKYPAVLDVPFTRAWRCCATAKTRTSPRRFTATEMLRRAGRRQREAHRGRRAQLQ